ncbi:threonine/serine exporter [Macrococcus carouselicus]|uniref:Threonine/serine exporter n=1 Tax=Macrococcus carouselicus TaxID=69969 RepID=A0A9Q8CM76_9STAP|nr:threonine/serine exporter [Macrococcus carouselicus]
MLWFLLQFVTSFFATAFFAIIFNAPRKLLIPSGLVGAVGWIVYYVLNTYDVSAVTASFAGSLCLGVMAHLMSRYYRQPVIIFYVAGIIPLVPGGLAYDATKNLVISDYSTALQNGIQVTLISGAIAFGLIVAEMIFHSFFRARKYIRRR